MVKRRSGGTSLTVIEPAGVTPARPAATGRAHRRSRANYVDLVREIGVGDFRVKYQNSVLGYVWSLGKPLILFLVIYFVFHGFLKIGNDIPNFPLYLLLGIVFWTYFSESTLVSMHSVVGYGPLIRKVYFPRELLIFAATVTTTLTFLLNLAALFALLFLFRVPLSARALLIVPLLLQLLALSLGLSLILASIFVRFRDLAHIWEIVLQALFYATPVLYPVTLLPQGAVRKVLLLNPLAEILQNARYVLVTTTSVRSEQVLGALWPVPYAATAIVLVVGWLLFRRASATFAEDV